MFGSRNTNHGNKNYFNIINFFSFPTTLKFITLTFIIRNNWHTSFLLKHSSFIRLGLDLSEKRLYFIMCPESDLKCILSVQFSLLTLAYVVSLCVCVSYSWWWQKPIQSGENHKYMELFWWQSSNFRSELWHRAIFDYIKYSLHYCPIFLSAFLLYFWI